MPTIIFEANKIGPQKQAEEPQGGKLVDICDDIDAPVPFSCRGASCGTCRVKVVSGNEYLLPPEEEELSVLEIFADPPTIRLACCAKIKPGSGIVQLKVVDD